MTGAPDLVCILLKLHSAVQVRANGGESTPFILIASDQDSRFVAKLEDPARVGREVVGLADHDLIHHRSSHVRRHHEPDGGIEE
jgi:hypothetical protein